MMSLARSALNAIGMFGKPAGAREAVPATVVDAVPLNRRHWLVLAVCAAGLFFDSLDLQMMSLVMPVVQDQWSLTPRRIGQIASSAMVGMLVGSLLFGMLADRIGRRTAFQLTVALFAAFSASCAFAQDSVQLMVLRFVAGIGIGGLIPVDNALLTEYLPVRWRGRMIALWGVAFPVGGLAASWSAGSVLAVWGWRGALAIGAVPALLVLAVRMTIPETPRFLAARGRFDEAAASLRWIAGGATVPREGVPVAAPTARAGVAGLVSPPHRRATAVGGLLWFCWSFAYFGIMLWLPTLLVLRKVPLTDVLHYVSGFALAAIAGRVVLLLVVDRIGRRVCIVVAGLAAAALMPVFGAQHALPWLIVAGLALSFFQDGGFSGIVPFTSELYPTPLRSTGVGWANGLGRAAALLAPLLVGELVAAGSGYAAFLIFAGCYLCASAVAMVGRETSGRLLEDVPRREPV